MNLKTTNEKSRKKMPEPKPCVIDLIVKKQEKAYLVSESEHFIAFLDHHPLFPGHTLLAPKHHVRTLYDLPDELIGPFFHLAKQLAAAIEEAMGASGSFIALNNKVSQSIPHLHVHLVPRNKGDGLKGFFWPRTRYLDEAHCLEVQEKIKHCLLRLEFNTN
jgi:histidine triad (HIT) family protein